MRGGFVDETPGLGYLWTENAVTPLEQDARSVGLRRRDGESDIFTAVFNGKKVDFIIRMNENKQIYALPLGQTDVRIECEGTSTEITGWAITDNNGDCYIYRQREICKDVEYVMFLLPMLFQIPVIPQRGILPVFFHTMGQRLVSTIMAMQCCLLIIQYQIT